MGRTEGCAPEVRHADLMQQCRFCLVFSQKTQIGTNIFYQLTYTAVQFDTSRIGSLRHGRRHVRDERLQELSKPPFQSRMASSTFHHNFRGYPRLRRSTFAKINRVLEKVIGYSTVTVSPLNSGI